MKLVYMETYKSKINSLEIKKTNLVNTLDILIPDSEFNEFRDKIQALNAELYKYRSLSFIDELGSKESYYLHRKIRIDDNILHDICDKLNVKDVTIFEHQLEVSYREYCDLHN